LRNVLALIYRKYIIHVRVRINITSIIALHSFLFKIPEGLFSMQFCKVFLTCPSVRRHIFRCYEAHLI